MRSRSISDLSIMVSVKPSYLAYAIVSSVFTALSAVCVMLRFFHRRKVGGLQWDDWTILLALAISVACLVVILLPTSICPRILQDDPTIIYTDTELNTWTKTVTATQMLYAGSVTLSRSSIVIFYRRIFSVDTRFLMFTHFMLLSILASLLAFIFVTAFAYTPVEAQWDVSMQATSSTIQARAWAIPISAIYTLLDILVFLMAAHRTWQLQIDRKRKILLSLLFFVGTLPLIAVIMRLTYFTKNVPRLALNLQFPGMTWSSVEMNSIIICACLPMCYSLLVARATRVDKSGQPEDAGYHEINPRRPVPKGPNSSAMFQADRRQLLDDERHHVMPGPEFEMREDYSNSLPMVHVRGQ